MQKIFYLLLICHTYQLFAQRNYEKVYENLEYGKKLCYQIDFRHKINAPFFTQGYEFSRILVRAVRNKYLKVYSNSTYDTLLSIELFNKKLKIPYLDGGDDLDIGSDDIDTTKFKTRDKDDPIYYLFKQLYIVEFEELYYFDSRYSQFKRKILNMSLILPAEVNPFGIDQYIGSFKYKDVIRALKASRTKLWRNSQNDNQNIDFIEALENRLFSARLIRYEDPRLNVMVDMYEGANNLKLSEQVILKLIEKQLRYWKY